MRIWIPKIFRRDTEPAPAAPPAAMPVTPRGVQESVVDSVPVTYMESRIPEVDSAFGYGHLDGRRGVDAEHFRGFIEHTVEGEGIDQRIAELKAEEVDLRQRASVLRQQRADLAAGGETLRHLREQQERHATNLREAEARLKEVNASLEEKRWSGSYSHAIMFIAAAVVFIIGDVVMTQRIVADALRLTGHKFLGLMDESWMFAAGLAMISVVLKPAYDRLVEKPYWKHQEKRFVWVICVLAVMSVVTLGVLGVFRAQSYRDQLAVRAVQADKQLSPAQKRTQLQTIQGRMANSPMGTASFVLSGLLFAAAGAVTLSIGVRYAREIRHVRLPALREQKAVSGILESARTQRDEVSARLAERTQEMERLRTMVGDAPPLAAIEERADSLWTERRELQQQLVTTRHRRLRNLYDDGYELGSVLARAADAAADEERPRRKRPRPFVALRRAIREMALTPETLN